MKPSKEAYWRVQLADLASSGMSQKAFCESRGLSVASLQYWRKRLVASPTDSPFVKAEASKPAPREASLTVCLPNGISLDYKGIIDVTLIQSLAAIGG